MRKRMKILFTISVLLNVVFLGIAAGGMVKSWNQHPANAMAQEMSPEGRHIVARKLQKAFKENRDDMRKMRKTKQSLQDVLTAEKFDADAFEKLAEDMNAFRAEKGAKRIKITKDLAQDLSLEDRKVLAKRFSKGFKGAKRGNRDSEPRSFLRAFDYPKAPDGWSKRKKNNEGPELPTDMPPQP